MKHFKYIALLGVLCAGTMPMVSSAARNELKSRIDQVASIEQDLNKLSIQVLIYKVLQLSDDGIKKVLQISDEDIKNWEMQSDYDYFKKVDNVSLETLYKWRAEALDLKLRINRLNAMQDIELKQHLNDLSNLIETLIHYKQLNWFQRFAFKWNLKK